MLYWGFCREIFEMVYTSKKECMKIFELSKLHVFVNKWFEATLNIAIHPVSHSSGQLFFEAKKLSHIKSDNEMTSRLVLKIRIILC